MADKDGQRARLDTMVRQKLYFLSIDPPPPEVDSPVFAEPTADTKPFSFADFAKSQPIRSLSEKFINEYLSQVEATKKINKTRYSILPFIGSLRVNIKVITITK